MVTHDIELFCEKTYVLTNVLGMIISHVSKIFFFWNIGLEIISTWVLIFKTTSIFYKLIAFKWKICTKIPTTFILSYFLFSFLFNLGAFTLINIKIKYNLWFFYHKLKCTNLYFCRPAICYDRLGYVSTTAFFQTVGLLPMLTVLVSFPWVKWTLEHQDATLKLV